MEVEAKMQLVDAAAYDAVITALAPHRVPCDADGGGGGGGGGGTLQESRFFDTADGTLAAAQTVCRVRLTQGGGRPSHASVSLKEHGAVDDGSTARILHKDIVPFAAAAAAADQRGIGDLLAAAPAVAAALKAILGGGSSGGAVPPLEPVGCFHNRRDTFLWAACQSQPGLRLHVDRTAYPFGERFEVEVPGITVPVDDVIEELGRTLCSLGVVHYPGEASKFEQLTAGLLAMRAADHMSVQAKILLAGPADYAAVRAGRVAHLVHEDTEHNHFFDGPGGELLAADSFFRLRLTEHPPRARATLKAGVVDGGSLCWRQEHDLPPAVAERLLAGDAALLFAARETEPIAAALYAKFGVSALRPIGGFDNHRTTAAWPEAAELQPGLRLHIDRTEYSFGERFEVEVPDITVPVDDVVAELRRLLDGLGVAYSTGHSSKFGHLQMGAGRPA